jgi:hypothetical protein
MIAINDYNLNPTACHIPMKIESSIVNASITGMLEGTHRISKLILIWQLTVVKYEGTDAHYLIEPNEPMVATVRSTQQTVCTFNTTARNCVPSGKFNLSSGSFIDFAFGVGSTQNVRFYYAVLHAE